MCMMMNNVLSRCADCKFRELVMNLDKRSFMLHIAIQLATTLVHNVNNILATKSLVYMPPNC